VSTTAQPAISHPPGWYHDATGQALRYWDGVAWTGHMAPLPPMLAPPPGKPEPRVGDWVGAALLPLLMPLIGLIAGIIWTVIGGAKRPPGLLCLGLSAGAITVWSLVAGLG
jgi:hypothetical protein